MMYMIIVTLLLSATHCLAMNPTNKRLKRVQDQSGFTFTEIQARFVPAGVRLRPPLQHSESGVSQVAHSSKSSSNNSGRMHPFAVRSRSGSASTQLSCIVPAPAESAMVALDERILFAESAPRPERSALQSPRLAALDPAPGVPRPTLRQRARSERALSRPVSSVSGEDVVPQLSAALSALIEAQPVQPPVPVRKKTSWWALFACTRTTSAD